jgi:transcriptional regulator with XRE-family HTH domain
MTKKYEQAKSLGAALKSVREKRNFSIEEISDRMNMKTEDVLAIEEDKIDILDVLRMYANAAGLQVNIHMSLAENNDKENEMDSEILIGNSLKKINFKLASFMTEQEEVYVSFVKEFIGENDGEEYAIDNQEITFKLSSLDKIVSALQTIAADAKKYQDGDIDTDKIGLEYDSSGLIAVENFMTIDEINKIRDKSND